jgi:hypothetical protein
MTRSAAASALTVSGPSDGGQSSSVNANRSRTPLSASRSRVSEPGRRGSSIVAPARSGVDTSSDSRSTAVGRIASSAATSPVSTS